MSAKRPDASEATKKEATSDVKNEKSINVSVRKVINMVSCKSKCTGNPTVVIKR